MNKNEEVLLEAIRGMLHQDAKLGLSYHKPPHDKRESSHFSQYQWEGIDDMFELLVSESKFANSLTAAFFKVHGYKYIDDPLFKLSLEAELRSMGVPTEEKEFALKNIDKILKECSVCERDAGWNPSMDKLKDVTSNADARKLKSKPEAPWTGGGPNPQPVSRRGGEPFAVINGTTKKT